MASSSSFPAPLSGHTQVHRVQSNAPTMRRAQQRANAPYSARRQKSIVKISLGSPYPLPSNVLSLNDSLRVLDILSSHFAQQPLSFNSPERGLRGKRRRLARLQKMDAASAPTGSTIEQLTTNEEKQQQGADGAERVDVALSGMGTAEGRLAEVTFGLNATTRALETAVASASSPLTSPYALLVLTSSCPPSLTSHYAHFSHHLHLPLLSLHPSISSAQLAHALHPTLTSLLVLAFHYVPSSAVLPQLHPFARVLRVAWLEAGGEGADWRGLRVERVARTAEREAREDAKRRKKEEAERAARPLSPKSIAAKVWKDNEQRRKEAEQAAAAHSLPPDAAAPASVSPPSPSVFTGADTVIIH